ncbi:hypothetical protein AHiyo1_02320 [Arthrobacter sp. Hiyo1]|nr:hypothetical protein AHiyo1_02320 [Arthrobacter sp. Hiyo1]
MARAAKASHGTGAKTKSANPTTAVAEHQRITGTLPKRSRTTVPAKRPTVINVTKIP